MSRFSVIAKNENKANSCLLLLRGYINLNCACTRVHVKKLLGKYSNCKMTTHGDVVNLLKCFNVNKDVTVTGKLPSQNSRWRDDARWVMKVV